MTDTPSTRDTVAPQSAMLAFATELRRLAAQVERGIRTNKPASVLSALSGMSPIGEILAGVASRSLLGDAVAAPTGVLAAVNDAEHPAPGYL